MRLLAALTRPLLTFFILLIAAAGIFITLWSPPAWTLAVGAPNDGAHVVNFYRPETSDGETYRWSGPGSKLQLPTLDGVPAMLALRMHTLGDKSQPLVLLPDRQLPITMSVGLSWRTYRVLLPTRLASVFPSSFNIAFDGPTQQPNPRDPREIGVALANVTLAPLNSSTSPYKLFDNTLLLMLPLAFVTFIVLRFTVGRWPLLLVASTAAVLIVWAHYDLFTLVPLVYICALVYGIVTWFVREEGHNVRFIATNAFRRLQQRQSRALLIVGVVAVAHVALLLPLEFVGLRSIAAWLLMLLPGALLAWLIFRAEASLAVLIFLSMCSGVALLVLLMLALHILPGPLPGWLVLACCDAISVWVGWLLWRQGARSQEPGARSQELRLPPLHLFTSSPLHLFTSSPFLLLVAVLFLGAALRLPWLGGPEFHDDEAAVLLMATGVANGQDDVLMLHRKGPVEILLPAAPLVVTGQVNEFSARLPFALASIGALLGIYVLAQTMLALPASASRPDSTAWLAWYLARTPWDDVGRSTREYAGLFAALLLALDGFLIAYARTVQYQSIIVLMTLGALWCAWRFYAGAEKRRYLIGAAVFASVALLAHWDGVFTLPALAWLVLAGGGRRGWHTGAWLRGLAWPLLTGALLVGSFYIPFVRHPHFQQTTAYLRWRVGRQGTVFNNLPSYYDLATFYNTRFQMIALGVVLVGALLVWLWKYARVERWPTHWLACALLCLASVLAFSISTDTDERFAWAILLLFALPLAALIISPKTPMALRTLALWFAPPFLAEGFIVASPRTHFYTMDTAALMLVGFALAHVVAKVKEQKAKMVYIPAFTLILLPFAFVIATSVPYLYLVFLRQEPEYQRTFPANRPALYQTSYGDARPDETFLFGFPHRDGWKVIAELYARGVLKGDYNTNQKPEIAGWYTRDVPRCDRDPANYFVAWNAPQIGVPAKYHRVGDVYVDGVRALSIFQRAPVQGALKRYDLSDFRSSFDQQWLAPFPTALLLNELTPQHALDARWQGGARLRGYDVSHAALHPGDTATLWLYWQPDTPPGTLDLALDVLDSRGHTVAQAAPYCGTNSGVDWPAGELSTTAYTLTANTDLPPGTYTVRVALRQHNGPAIALTTGAETLSFASFTVAP